MSKGTALMSTKAMDFIKSILPEGSTILEFGSGPGSTVYLSDNYNMISIENQPEWQNKYPICTTYINVDHWDDILDTEVKDKPAKVEYKLDARGNAVLGYCDKCGESDCYKEYDLNKESRCCKEKIKPKRKNK